MSSLPTCRASAHTSTSPASLTTRSLPSASARRA
jgi:hypothetical protein